MYIGISVYEEYSNGFAIFISPNTPILRRFLFRKLDITHHIMLGEFKHEVRQFQKPYDNQQAEQISLMV